MKYKIHKTDEESKRQLTPHQFDVARKRGTNRHLPENTGTRTIREYILCLLGNPLFASEQNLIRERLASFPSPADQNNIEEQSDRSMGMLRVEVKCGNCDAHLGQFSRMAHNRPASGTHEFRITQIHERIKYHGHSHKKIHRAALFSLIDFAGIVADWHLSAVVFETSDKWKSVCHLGFLLIVAAGHQIPSDKLLGPLESKYQPITDINTIAGRNRYIR